MNKNVEGTFPIILFIVFIAIFCIILRLTYLGKELEIKSCNKACEPYQVAVCDEHYVTCKGRTGISLHKTEEE